MLFLLLPVLVTVAATLPPPLTRHTHKTCSDLLLLRSSNPFSKISNLVNTALSKNKPVLSLPAELSASTPKALSLHAEVASAKEAVVPTAWLSPVLSVSNAEPDNAKSPAVSAVGPTRTENASKLYSYDSRDSLPVPFPCIYIHLGIFNHSTTPVNSCSSLRIAKYPFSFHPFLA